MERSLLGDALGFGGFDLREEGLGASFRRDESFGTVVSRDVTMGLGKSRPEVRAASTFLPVLGGSIFVHSYFWSVWSCQTVQQKTKR